MAIGRPYARWIGLCILLILIFITLPLFGNHPEGEDYLNDPSGNQREPFTSRINGLNRHKTRPQHQQLSDADNWRKKLATIRPVDSKPHSKTLGIADALYVVSLPRRTDRRASMDSIAKALDLDFKYIDATDFGEEGPGKGKELIEKLMDRMEWQRHNRIDEREALPEDWPIPFNDTNGGFIERAFPFQWSPDAVDNHQHPLAKKIEMSGADRWDLDPEWEKANPMERLSAKERAELRCSSLTNKLNYRGAKLTKAMVSCWHSHMNAFRQIMKDQPPVSIIFEDDIDMEWDIEQRLNMMWPHLPTDWDIVYLGHCFSKEYAGPFIPGAPTLRKSTNALCTHAYAMSLAGATRIYRHLRSSDYAYTRPVDHAIRELSLMGKIQSWSVYPPIVIQTKNDKSDIVGTMDIGWRIYEDLADSTLERIELAEKEIERGE
ncbi:hypothetical protein SISNIDRAFT_452552 [Sistotremastrum niveocremeum HHB9708]|uniref:Glycosyl transferase family 25 domain-containing protein n=1 Tax=Sistotremastrum niveocremeum HHB9708 TaxID=1314777 RepID=A0A164WNG1_9AGAM|nr:hypothetical protein SISNIDRAFT_452552 [Sistotremastrum niveocremeum HHB9708]